MTVSTGVEAVAPDILRVSAPMPHQRPPTVCFYLVRDRDEVLHLIDTGLDDDASRLHLAAGLRALGRNDTDIRTVSVTHNHRDHIGLADFVRSRSGAPVALHGDDIRSSPGPDPLPLATLLDWGVPAALHDRFRKVGAPMLRSSVIDRELDDGAWLGFDDFRVVHTPGHTPGSICMVSDARKVVFTGDHLLPDQFPGIGRGAMISGNPVADYRDSLARLEAFDGYLALPGHGRAFSDLGNRVRQTTAHLEHRAAEISRVIERRPNASIWEVAKQVTWSAGWNGLSDRHIVSALRQTSWYRDLLGD